MSSPSSAKLRFISTQLRRARREKNLSQEELAERLGVHRSTLIRWESGLCAPPKEQEQALSKVLGVPVNWFYQGDIDPMSPTWITDPWLRRTPLPRLQELTAASLKSLKLGAFKLSQLTRLTGPRLEELMAGELPTAQEIQQLRDHLGEDFNPTPTLTRKAERRPLFPNPSETTAVELSLEEKVDLILQRLARLEKHQLRIEEMLQRGLSGQIE